MGEVWAVAISQPVSENKLDAVVDVRAESRHWSETPH